MSYRIEKTSIGTDIVMKEIKGFEGFYAITQSGKVWSYPRIRQHQSRKGLIFTILYKGKWLNSHINKKDGYNYISITDKNHNSITCKIHRLVAQTYISNSNNKAEINHKNGIKTDNRVENLEWNTRQENAIHASKNNLMLKNENHPNCFLSDKEVRKIRKITLQNKYTQRKLGEMFSVSQTHISRIINNQLRIYGI